MPRLALLFQFVKRFVAWGIWLGLACGGGFGTLLILFSVVVGMAGGDPALAPPTPRDAIIQGVLFLLLMSVLFGMWIGGVLGLALGFLDGVLMGVLTITAFPSAVKPAPYRRVTGVSILVQTLAISLMGLRLLRTPQIGDPTEMFFFISIPIIATLAALYGSQKVAAWYLLSLAVDGELREA